MQVDVSLLKSDKIQMKDIYLSKCLITVDVDLDLLAEAVLVEFSHCTVISFSLLLEGFYYAQPTLEHEGVGNSLLLKDGVSMLI